MLEIKIDGPIFDSSKVQIQNRVKPGEEVRMTFADGLIFTSLSVNNWINFIQTTVKGMNLKLVLFHCPVSFITNVNTIKNFLPSDSLIQSFYVPYFSNFTNETKQILFRRAVEFDEKALKLPICKDSKGNIMELDVISESYFSFLNLK